MRLDDFNVSSIKTAKVKVLTSTIVWEFLDDFSNVLNEWKFVEDLKNVRELENIGLGVNTAVRPVKVTFSLRIVSFPLLPRGYKTA